MKTLSLAKSVLWTTLGLSVLSASVLAQGTHSSKIMTFSMEVTKGGDVLSLTHGSEQGLTRFPEGIAALVDPAIKSSLALTAVLHDETGAVAGLASELEYFPDGQRSGAQWQTHWTLLLPGRGSIYGFETESIPEEHVPPFVQVAEGKPWKGEIRAKVASGPADNGRGVIVGGTGEFAEATGTIAEFFILREVRLDGTIIGTLELEIELD